MQHLWCISLESGEILFIAVLPLTCGKISLQENAFTDAMIYCHFAMILICFMRDNFPNVECCLDHTGSDPCESFFSLNGQWVRNHYNYSFGEMLGNINHMSRLLEIQADPQGSKFSKPHAKQENIRRNQFPPNISDVNLTDYPRKGMEIDAWCSGIQMA